MDKLAKIDAAIARVEKSIAVVLFIVLALLVFFNTLARNLLGVSSRLALDLVPVVVLWLTLCGATLALRENRHIRLELVLRHLPEQMHRLAGSITSGFALIVMAILFWAAFGFVRNETAMFGAWGYTSVVFVLFFGLATLRFALALLAALRPPRTDKRQAEN